MTRFEQIVLKQKIKTLLLPDLHDSMEQAALDNAHTESKKRDEVDREIRQRQERWRRTGSAPATEESPSR